MIHHRGPLRNQNCQTTGTLDSPNVKQKLQVVWSFCPVRLAEIHPPSKDEGLRDIGHNMTMLLDTKKSNSSSQLVLRFHILFIMTFYYKLQ